MDPTDLLGFPCRSRGIAAPSPPKVASAGVACRRPSNIAVVPHRGTDQEERRESRRVRDRRASDVADPGSVARRILREPASGTCSAVPFFSGVAVGVGVRLAGAVSSVCRLGCHLGASQSVQFVVLSEARKESKFRLLPRSAILSRLERNSDIRAGGMTRRRYVLTRALSQVPRATNSHDSPSHRVDSSQKVRVNIEHHRIRCQGTLKSALIIKTMKVADPVRDDRLLGGNLVPLHPCAGKSKAMGHQQQCACRRVEPAATLLELAGNARTRNGRHIRG